MASKRMFDKAIVDTDRFTDMPLSTKALYFLMGMEADDYGFVSPRRVMRMHGGTEDDVKILISKGFVIPFESGVVVITHWHKHNYLDKNRIKFTEYTDELALLTISDRTYQLITLHQMLNTSTTTFQPTLNNRLAQVEDTINDKSPEVAEYQGLTFFKPALNQESVEEDSGEEDSIGEESVGTYALSAYAATPSNHTLANSFDLPIPETIEEHSRASTHLQHQHSQIQSPIHENQKIVCKKKHQEPPPPVQTPIVQMDVAKTESAIHTIPLSLNDNFENICKEKQQEPPLPVQTDVAEADSVIITIPLNDNTEYVITHKTCHQWVELYPAVDVIQELRKYKGWTLANPTKRKTRRGILKSINSWLASEQDKGGNYGNRSNSIIRNIVNSNQKNHKFGGRQYANNAGSSQQSNPYSVIKSAKF